jgi:uncharacterized protein
VTAEKYQLHPDGNFYTIPELESKIRFKYLPSITFETLDMKEAIRNRGLAKLKNKEVTPQSQKLGKKLTPLIESSYIPKVSIRWVHDRVGYGLFAEEELSKGAYAGEYTGIVRENNRRYSEALNNYCYEYPVPDDIGRNFVTDATDGHLTRFINHSPHPNLQPFHVFYDGFYHLIFLSRFKIEKGEQLSFDYGHVYWYLRDPPQKI